MGYSRWSPDDYKTYSAATSTKSTTEIFKSRSLDPELDPKGVDMRESRDSDKNPESTAIIVACDVTGSMGVLADRLVREHMGTLFEEILDRKPVTDPHIMTMAIGDADYGYNNRRSDDAPLQVSQFEADITALKWLEKVYVEGGGGGNSHESYELPLYFAATHTSIDCFEKRGKKGYLFTIGDEDPSMTLKTYVVKKIIGDDIQADIPLKDLYEQASKMYHIFHLVATQGSHCRFHGADSVMKKWKGVYGQRVQPLTDINSLSEVIISMIEVNEGRDKEDVIKSWSGDTSIAVQNAVSSMNAVAAFNSAIDVVRL